MTGRPLRLGLLFPEADPISPAHWSGTPLGLFNGFLANGVDVVPLGCALPVPARALVGALGRATGRRGAVARRWAPSVFARSRVIRANAEAAMPLDVILAMNTDTYDLGRIVPPGVRVATYDDGTFAQFLQHPDSDLTTTQFPARDVQAWIRRQGEGCRRADLCFVSTNWAGRSVIEDYRVPAARVQAVGMGHRPRPRSAASRDYNAPRFLFVGVDWERKNGPAVLRAFAELRREIPQATLDVVGRHEPITAPGVTDHGLLQRDDPAAQALLDDLFARATAFVLPSRFDPAGIAYLEAASAGVAVIATTEGGAGELLREAAISVPPRDEAALLAALRRLADPATAQSMGEAAARRAVDSSWDAVAGRIIAALGRDATAGTR